MPIEGSIIEKRKNIKVTNIMKEIITSTCEPLLFFGKKL
jgi:hypothetical protein